MDHYAVTFSNKYKNMTEGADPIIDNWPLMGSPIPVLAIAALYLSFVLHLGPRWMRNRKPLEMKRTLILYNATQVVFSVLLCIQPFFIGGLSHMFNVSCNASTALDKSTQMAIWKGTWWYLVMKVIELLDTVFFVLRKKHNQVSFLHVYHHTIMVVFTWGYLKYLPGAQGAFLGILNSFVHIVMYTYYLIAALGPRYQKYLWWKKYMTTLQLLQFGIMLVYLFLIITFQCSAPRSLSFFFVINVTIFLFLFWNFYRNAYGQRERCGKQKAQ
ncbi:elongation of very long chain fatty acids protein 7 [Toxorhynchites rutilus septentrionalis]|uniref:elongation of very long chain fatty acids protein 7 n=1 Tax=Toxorhynchites rutilus septentrionalis TaxID=329112 RepID=UPI002478D5E0|nr:elongation of very long chain fatty acids protein 7 [Toxorhynchites rutilus septentrionalis]